jgi:hypothetical protein
MAVGGAVRGDCLECPFHLWRFKGEDGKCAAIPYSDKGNAVYTYVSGKIQGLHAPSIQPLSGWTQHRAPFYLIGAFLQDIRHRRVLKSCVICTSLIGYS